MYVRVKWDKVKVWQGEQDKVKVCQDEVRQSKVMSGVGQRERM